MQKSAILQMFYGERGSMNDVPNSREYSEQLDKFCEAEKDFLEKISGVPDYQALYRQFLENVFELQCRSMDDYFSEGFRFGVLMGLDVANFKKRGE